MIQINVSQLMRASIGTIRNYKIDEMVDIAGCDRPTKGEVTLLRTDKGILVKGVLNTDIELTCGRCLNVFNYPITLKIEEVFYPTIDTTTGTSLPEPEDPDSFTINERNILDLTEAIRQYALMAIPMKPLCHEDCAGLCPTCGANLNQSPCDCPRPADPRWSELIKLAFDNTEKSK